MQHGVQGNLRREAIAQKMPPDEPSLIPPPPSLVVVEQPFNCSPPQIGSSISPDSIISNFANLLPTGGAGASKQAPAMQPPPQMAPEPPMLAGRGPPMLRRQNASRFSWPPDAMQEWTYIAMTPTDLAAQCETALNRPTTALEVAEFFSAPAASESPAYSAYYARHSADIEGLLAMHETE